MEIWKPIKDFSNYEISNTGKVRSLNYNKTKVTKELKPRKLVNGYLQIQLWNNFGKPKDMLIHRLVAVSFVDNPHNFPIVNHKDEDRANNNAFNLEWCDAKYNLNYKNRNSKLSKRMTINSTYDLGVKQYDLQGNFITNFSNAVEAGKSLEGNYHNNAISITRCCNGLRKTCKGFIWKFNIE